jgi:hypothetical protein
MLNVIISIGFGAITTHKAHKTLFYGLRACLYKRWLSGFGCQHSFEKPNGFGDPG